MIEICEVGPRDGLQTEKTILSTAHKITLIQKLIDSGIKKIEVTSFVNPKIVPQMSDAEQLIKELPIVEDVIYTGLLLSRSGLERALTTNLTHYNVVLAVSNTFNLKNAKRSVRQSLFELTAIIQEAKANNKYVNVTLGTAFGCPYEGEIAIDYLLTIAARFIEAGVDEITFADTTGLANPLKVEKTIKAYERTFGTDIPLGLHFHNTRGLGIANALAGLQQGITRFDSSIAGIGGCPFAPKAVGNICTDDFVYMLQSMGYETGISLEKLVNTSKWLEEKLGRTLEGMYMKTID